MKKSRLFPILMAAIATLFSCAPKAEQPRILVLYYSQTGITEQVAQEIVNLTGADIEPVKAIPPYDGDYAQTIERSGREREEGILPDIEPLTSDIASYDIVFLGFPVWFGTYAPPIAKLLENPAPFAGVKVVPFCTFGSGGLESSTKNLKECLGESEILEGYGVRAARIGEMPAEIARFLTEGKFIEGEVAPLEPFSEVRDVTPGEAAIFDEAVKDYRMISARAKTACSRQLPDGNGVEYLFTAENLPREGMPPRGVPNNMEMKVYVLVKEGEAPVFTRVVR